MNPPVLPEAFALTTVERQSPLWRRLEGYLDTRIAELRTQNDDQSKDATATAALRGQIKALKALRSLGQERQQIE